jgi:PPM family protein phosphatase
MGNAPVEMTLRVDSYPRTDVGRKRSNNEDWVAGFEPTDATEIQNSGYLYIVADGVGGADKGERASQFAAQKVLYEYYQHSQFPPAERLADLIRSAGNEIYQYSIDNGTPRMATTFVAAVIRGDTLTVANVGDSRAYLFRNGQIKQITSDHNLANELVRNGSMTPEEAKRSKTRNKLMRSLGGERNVDVDLFRDIQLYPGDFVLLCSDGLTRYISTEEDLLRLMAGGILEEIGDRMIDFANRSGGADNISLYLIAISPQGQGLARAPFSSAPGPVDLDTLQTQSGIPRIKKKGSIKTPFKRKSVLYILIGLLALVILSGSFVLASLGKGSETALLPSQEAATSTMISKDTAIPPLPTSEATLSDVGSINPISTQPADVKPTESGVLASTKTESAQTPTNSSPTIISASKLSCVHQVGSGDNMNKILSLFGLPFRSTTIYYEYKNCNLDQKTCQGQAVQLENPDKISPGQLLSIPEVGKDVCEGVSKSYWVTVNP